MSDTPLSHDAIGRDPGRDPAQLRRRARRRLVGAVAIALTAVVVVPMLFDPEPKPLGPDVDVRIPGQETPFEPAPAPARPAAVPEAPAQSAEPTRPAPAVAAAVEEKPLPAEPTPMSAAPPKPAAEPSREVKKTPPKPAPEAKKSEPAKADAAFASKGYYLQLGAFSSAANAKTLLDKAQAAGFKASMTDSNSQYRVRVGPIADRDKAMEMLSRLKGKGFSPVIIGP